MDTTDISPTSCQRRIAVVTSCRADWGLLHGVVRELQRLSGAEPLIVATNMHLNPAFGHTVDEIEADGFPVAARVEMNTPGGDTSPLAYIIPGIFTELSAATGCYFWKAKAENEIKLDTIRRQKELEQSKKQNTEPGEYDPGSNYEGGTP